MFDRFSIDMVDKRYKDIPCISCTQIDNPDNIVFICICYLPPATSSRGDRSHDVFDILRSQCLKYQDKGTTGKSIMDYTLVQVEQFHKFFNFEVKTVIDVLESFSIPTYSSMPDHSLTCWDYIRPEIPLNMTPAQPPTSG